LNTTALEEQEFGEANVALALYSPINLGCPVGIGYVSQFADNSVNQRVFYGEIIAMTLTRL
jgi:hypothetical protein